ncbi:MAG TPA: polyphosphate kinase 1 [Bacteroidetes bacterium]|nr:polyphosphate kinase 1 [Bacteroidota bacterium]
MADKKIFINREVSWLYFNERVLQEAMDRNNPLIERLKFLGIFSSNRDEFFRVRVASVRRMLNMDRSKREFLDHDPEAVLKDIFKIVGEQEKRFTQTFFEIREELAKENIIFVDEKGLDKQQGKFVQQYFNNEVRSYLFPIMLKNLKNPDTLRDGYIYLVVVLKDSAGDHPEDYSLIMLPTDTIPRFIQLPSKGGKHYLIMLDDMLRYSMGEIFKTFGYDAFEAYTIKFTRDAELDIDDDVSKSFIELMSESVKKRKKGVPVRFVYDKEIPDILLQRLLQKLYIDKSDTLRGGGRYHNFKDFMSFPELGSKKLVYPPTPPLRHKLLPRNSSILNVIRKQDIMLHYPYQTFGYIVDLLREVAIDPQVRAIKMTFYRAARNSNVINALINAARNGKNVTVFLEIQARFDEEANIYWVEKLSEEGVKIIKTLPGFKVHAKMMLIRRKEYGENVYYANISTGNFNESTARVYTDASLLTANQEITREVNALFHIFEAPYNPPQFKHLLVAPYYMRKSLIKLLNVEIRNVKKGKKAWAILKMNSLVDPKIAKKLYQASQAGVKIDLICRGICVLKPGVKGLSENINAISIVDKFLEHSRVFIFANDGDAKYYFGSADWMIRNFDHRFEVICPVYDKNIQKEIKDIIDFQLADNVKSRLLTLNPINAYRKTGSGAPVRSQFAVYDYLKKKNS